MRKLLLALRNLNRNRRRTAIALGSIVFGVVAMLLAGGFIEWIFWAMRDSAIHSRLAHIQVARPGYFDQGSADPFAYLLPGTSPELQIINKMERVTVVAPRLAFTGLISHGDTTVSFLGEGIDPEKEAVLSEEVHIRHGENLSPKDDNEIVMGAGLAANLGIAPNDDVVLLVTTATGGINAVEARVKGIFYTATKAYDDSYLRIPISLANELLRIAGAHRWMVLLDDTAHTDSVLTRMKDMDSSTIELEFKAWYELADFYNKTVVLFKRQMSVVNSIIALIIILSISNLLTMSVLERTTEIGTLRAVGFRRRAILQLFLAEGAWLGIVGGLLGLVLGYLLAEGISIIGIPMPPPPGMEVGFTGEILITWPLLLTSLTVAMATSLIASIYPSWKASRLKIVDSLRFNT